MIALVALLLLPAQGEPASSSDIRLQLIRLQIDGRYGETLALAEAVASQGAGAAAPAGLDYLRGHLLELLGRPMEANELFAAAMSSAPELADYGRFRLAVNQERLKHPEVAAGLAATLLGRNPPPALIPPASRLLHRALEDGGDCRLLQKLGQWRLPVPESRLLAISFAECEARAGRVEGARQRMLALLREEIEDAVAREVAEHLSALAAGEVQPEVSLLLGLTFHHHREFEPALRHLEDALGEPEGALARDRRAEALYALARSRFWLGHHAAAAVAFGEVATIAANAEDRARSLFQQGRSLELAGDWNPARESFRRAYEVDLLGRWAAPALLSRLRIEWRLGQEVRALELFGALASRPQWQEMRSRAALFLAASDLVRGRADRAATWLDTVAGAPRAEVDYWRGRLAQLAGNRTTAVRRYLGALGSDPYHPLAGSARRELASPPLAELARAEGRRLAASGRLDDLHRAWLASADEGPEGQRARAALASTLAGLHAARPFLDLRPVPPEEWPLWRLPLRQPEEILLSLGIWRDAAPVMIRHFPASSPPLAFTASLLLDRAGEPRRSLYIAETLAARVPREVPAALLPREFRRLLFPLPWGDTIRAEASRRGVDPLLLAAVIREESRFDPAALSPASARGLTQFVLPTARRLADALALGELRVRDLEDPAVAIALGAAYLGELRHRLGDHAAIVLAAYNAGEDQARLWKSYCYSREPEEYFSKVGFSETKDYLRKVLTSLAHYREIYAVEPAP